MLIIMEFIIYLQMDRALGLILLTKLLKFTQTKSNLYTLENINPVDSSQFPTEAKRPSYSYLDNTKVIKTFRMEFHDWRFYLKEFLNKLELNDS